MIYFSWLLMERPVIYTDTEQVCIPKLRDKPVAISITHSNHFSPALSADRQI
ncbi:MAG: hypothetical protein WC868_08605 [Bacteroidales bacterium]